MKISAAHKFKTKSIRLHQFLIENVIFTTEFDEPLTHPTYAPPIFEYFNLMTNSIFF